MAGKYYSGADGSKLLVLDDDENRAKIVMSYDAKTKAWRSNQSNQAMTVELAHYEKLLIKNFCLINWSAPTIYRFQMERR